MPPPPIVEIIPQLAEEPPAKSREAGGDRKSDEYQKSVVELFPQPNIVEIIPQVQRDSKPG
jgi:hypothetical protein